MAVTRKWEVLEGERSEHCQLFTENLAECSISAIKKYPLTIASTFFREISNEKSFRVALDIALSSYSSQKDKETLN